MPNARVSAVGGAVPAITAFIPVTPSMRGLIENVVEDLLLLLEEIDGDADLENTREDDEADHDNEQPQHVDLEPWEGCRAHAEVRP